MKKILDKIRRKIIRKLHGICPDEVKPIRYATYTAHPVKLCVKKQIRYDMIPNRNPDAFSTHIMRDMAYQLADKMLIDNLFQIMYEENRAEDAIEFRMTVYAISPEDY